MVLNELSEASFPDSDKFLEKYNEYAEIDGKIVAMVNDGTGSYSEWLTKYESNINQELEKGANIITQMKRYDVSETSKTKTTLLEQLLDVRKEEVLIIKELAQEDNAANQLKRAEIRNKQGELLTELKKFN